jgi:hypothetical protein
MGKHLSRLRVRQQSWKHENIVNKKNVYGITTGFESSAMF